MVPDDPLRVEREAARASRAYHEHVHGRLDLEGRRAAVSDFAATFLEERIHVPLRAGHRAALDILRDRDALAIEMAHDGQLPHLGVVRLVLKSHDVAQLDGRAITLYLVGTHYSPQMRPDNLHFGMPLKGAPPDAVKHPPKVRIGKANAHKPFRWLPPPSPEELERLEEQIANFATNNLSFEGEGRLVAGAQDRLRARRDALFRLLVTAATSVENFGDWLIRVQYDLFHAMLGAEADRILILPMADMTALMQQDLAIIAREGQAIAALKRAVSQEQSARGEEPYQRAPEASSFWVHCPACTRRQRMAWSPGSPIALTCRVCGHERTIREEELQTWLLPDIAAYEAALFRLGIDGWVVGSRAAYHPVIERVYAHAFQSEMPPRFFLTSVPRFRGAGDPPGGYGKTRLLRAFLEMEPGAIAAALRAPWGQDPALVSDLLAPDARP